MAERGNQFLKILDRYGGIPLGFASSIWRRCERSVTPPPEQTKKIGILCLGAIGDLLLLSALINGIRTQDPHARIEVICSNSNKAALPLLTNVDQAFSCPIARPDRLARLVRQRSYDLFFDSTQWARIGNIISNFSGAGKTVGFRTKGQYRCNGYDVKVSHRSDQHEVENFLDLGRAIWSGFKGEPGLLIEDSEVQERRTIYCHMWAPFGKGRLLKEWPEEYWCHIIMELQRRGFKIGLTGDMEQAAKSAEFISAFFPGNPEVVSLAGKTDLRSLAALFRKAAAVISVNTGIMHLAALSEAKTIGLHGPTNPLRWGPWGENSISLQPEKGQMAYLDLGFEYPVNAVSSMMHLKPQMVLDALEKLNVI